MKHARKFNRKLPFTLDMWERWRERGFVLATMRSPGVQEMRTRLSSYDVAHIDGRHPFAMLLPYAPESHEHQALGD